MISNLFVGHNVIPLTKVDSTNNYARQLLRDKMPVDGTVIVIAVVSVIIVIKRKKHKTHIPATVEQGNVSSTNRYLPIEIVPF